MIIDWVAQHGLMFLIGITLILGLGCIQLSVLKEPILRQRCGELAILAALLWLIAAMIPMPRLLSLTSIFGNEEITATSRNVSPLTATGDLDSMSQADTAHASKSGDVANDVAKQGQAESADVRPVEISHPSRKKHRESNGGGAWWLPEAKQIPAIAAWGYMGTVMLCGAWLAIGRILVWWIVFGGNRIDEQSELVTAAKLPNLSAKQRWYSLSSRVRIVQSARCAIPFTYGILRPTIVLPSPENDRDDKKALVHALRHEWAHVQRGDAIGRAMMNVAFPLMPIHPLYWWLRRSAIFASELLADEFAASRSDRATYSSELIALLKQQSFARRLVLGASPIVSSKSEFYRRLELLLKRTKELRNRTTGIQRWSFLGVSLVIVCIAIGILGVQGPGLLSQDMGPPISPYDGVYFTDHWNIDNVISTSRNTPAVAIVIPESLTVEVRGTILDTDGGPAAGATVWAAAEFENAPMRERAITDIDGKFLLHLRPLNEHSAWKLAAFKGNKSAKIDLKSNWIKDITSKQPSPLVAQLNEHGLLRCRVIEQETNEAIPDARIYLDDGRIFVCDQNGQIDIDGIEEGAHGLVALASGHSRNYVNIDNTLQPNGILNVRLSKASQLAGTVTDMQGRPIPYATVSHATSGYPFAMQGRCVIANELGRFVLDGVIPERPIRYLMAFAHSYEPQIVQRIVSTEIKPVEISFKMPHIKSRKEDTGTQVYQSMSARSAPETKSRGLIRGRVVDPSGQSVRDFQIFVGAPSTISVDERAPNGLGMGQAISFSSADGSFILGNEILAGYVYRVMARVPGYGDASIERVSATPRDQVNVAEVHQLQLEEPHKVEFEVLDARNDQPIANANVTLITDRSYLDYLQFDWYSDEFGYPHQPTSENGTVQFKDIAFGESTVTIRADGYARQRFGWRDGESKFMVKLVPQSSISGHIAFNQKTDLDNVWISLRSFDGQDDGYPVDGKSTGDFRFPELPAGRYILEVSENTQEIYRGEFSIGTAESINVQLDADQHSGKLTLKQSSSSKSQSEAIATINGRDPNQLSFSEGFERFKRYMRCTEAKKVTASQLREGLRRASVELKNLHPKEAKDEIASALKQLAEGDSWPSGVRLYAQANYFATNKPSELIVFRIHIPHSGSNPSSPSADFFVEP